MEWIPLVQFSLSRPAIFCLANNIIMKGYEGCGSLHKDHAGPKADGKHIEIVLSTAPISSIEFGFGSTFLGEWNRLRCNINWILSPDIIIGKINTSNNDG